MMLFARKDIPELRSWLTHPYAQVARKSLEQSLAAALDNLLRAADDTTDPRVAKAVAVVRTLEAAKRDLRPLESDADESAG